jgi:hypothetical protein
VSLKLSLFASDHPFVSVAKRFSSLVATFDTSIYIFRTKAKSIFSGARCLQEKKKLFFASLNSQPFLLLSSSLPGLPDCSLVQYTKTGEKYTKWPQNVPNGH